MGQCHYNVRGWLERNALLVRMGGGEYPSGEDGLEVMMGEWQGCCVRMGWRLEVIHSGEGGWR